MFFYLEPETVIEMDARLGYKYREERNFHELVRSTEKRQVDCKVNKVCLCS